MNEGRARVHGPIDVLMPTYNSAKYLEEAISAIKRAVPVNRIIAVDHYSTDGTLEVLRRHGAEVYFEDRSLGYARQLLIEKASTDAFMMLDSDVVLSDGSWFGPAMALLGKKSGEGFRIGAVALIPEVNPPEPLRRYVEFWWRISPALERGFFVTHSTLFLREALEGIRIPAELGACEDGFIWAYMRKRGYASRSMRVKGVHHYVKSDRKPFWMGANLRVLHGILGREALPFVFRNVVAYPASATIAGLAMGDAEVIAYNLRRWLRYLQGYLRPEEFRRLER